MRPIRLDSGRIHSIHGLVNERMKTIDNRRARRVVKEQRDKKLLSFEREHNELCKAKYELPWIKLDEPLQKGWKRFFVLRKDILNRDDAHVLKDVLRRVNNTQYCDNKEFEKYIWNKDVWVPMEHHTRPIGIGEAERDPTFNERHRKFLWKGADWWTHHGWRKLFNGYWLKNQWMLEQQIEPHYVTHIQEIDPEIEAKLAHIDKKLYHDWKAYGRLIKLHGWKGWRHNDWHRSPPDDTLIKELRELYENENS